jgi:hypothetical protein
MNCDSDAVEFRPASIEQPWSAAIHVGAGAGQAARFAAHTNSIHLTGDPATKTRWQAAPGRVETILTDRERLLSEFLFF